MNDGIGTIDAGMLSESPHSNESTKQKTESPSYASTETRLKFVRKQALVEPPISTYAVYHAMKKKYGVGMDQVVIKKEMAKARKEETNVGVKNRDRKMAATHQKDWEERQRFTRDTLLKHPGMSHEDLNKMAMKKHGHEVTPHAYKKYSVKPTKAKSFKAKVVDGVKASLKAGTSPLKTEAKRMGQFFVAIGVEQATFKVIDGVPQWEITEKPVVTII